MMRREKVKGAAFVAVVIALAMVVPVGSWVGTSWAQQAQQPTSTTAQVPQPAQGGVNWAGAGWGAATLASNVVYIPAKLVYGVLGGLVGGASWALTGGNTQTADTIWRSSLGGDYVVTPDMLQGKKPVHFSGPTATAPAQQVSTVQPLNPSTSASSAAAGGAAPMASASTSGATTVASGGPAAAAGGSSMSPSSSMGSSSTGSSSSGSQPIDAGSGPVHRAPAGSPATALPSTSIE